MLEGKIQSIFDQLVLDFEVTNDHSMVLNSEGEGVYDTNQYDSQIVRYERDSGRLYLPGFDRCIAVDLEGLDPNEVKGLRCSGSNPSHKWTLNE